MSRRSRVMEWFEEEERPWGNFKVVAVGSRWKLKLITVKPKQALSLQSHKNRSEHWTIVGGKATVTLSDERHYLSEGQSIFIVKNAVHRLQNDTDDDLMVVEVQTGNCSESDITRYDDKYGR